MRYDYNNQERNSCRAEPSWGNALIFEIDVVLLSELMGCEITITRLVSGIEQLSPAIDMGDGVDFEISEILI